MDYEIMKANATRKLNELVAIFKAMELDRAAQSQVIETGDLGTVRDVLQKRYILAQMVICAMCAKLMEAAIAMLDA